jgi:hypothetical protein
MGDGTTNETTFDCHRKNFESWIGTKSLVYCRIYKAPTLFSKSTKEVFLRAGNNWYSLNMLPMVRLSVL